MISSQTVATMPPCTTPGYDSCSAAEGQRRLQPSPSAVSKKRSRSPVGLCGEQPKHW